MMPKNGRWMAGPGGITLACLFTRLASATAQDVLSPPPATDVTPQAVQQQQEQSPMQVFAPLTPAAGLGATGQPFRWGPVTLHPHLLYRVLYGNGIASSP